MRNKKSYKKRALEAIDNLILKYKVIIDTEDWSYVFGITRACPLCVIYHTETGCKGCPSADKKGLIGCTESITFIKLDAAFDVIQSILAESEGEEVELPTDDLIESLELRIKFWEQAKKLIITYHNGMFNPSTWQHFEALVQLDNKLINGVDT